MDSVRSVRQWPVTEVAVAVVDTAGDVVAAHGPQDRPFRLASVTKLLTSYAVLRAVHAGELDLDQPAGPPGSTVRHLLAHASGLAARQRRVADVPGARRIYSNTGFVVLAETLEACSGHPFADYLTETVLHPLGMQATYLDDSRSTGSPSTAPAATGAVSTCADLARFAGELHAPTLVPAQLLAEATEVAFPGLDGVLPGFGMRRPNDWGLGVELRDHKSPHWTGTTNSPQTFGHFGRSGTFLWVDPRAGIACVGLTNRDFDRWASATWPVLADEVLATFAAPTG